MRVQKFVCRECFQKAVIERTEWITDENGERNGVMVLRCTNLNCGHVWVQKNRFSHTLKASRLPPSTWLSHCDH